MIFHVVYTLVEPLIPEFDDLLDQESKLVDAQRINPYTAQIAEADKQNDRLIVGMKEIIVANMKYSDPVIVEAAIKLNNRMKSFGKIERKSYEEEAAAIRILLIDLQSPAFSHAVNVVGLGNWVMQLDVSLNNFRNLLEERNDNIALTLTQDNLKDVRKKLEVVYHKMTSRINAAAEIDASKQYEPFIHQINAEIQYFNEHTHRSAKKDLSEGDHTVIESIPVQIFSDEPLTPIPIVYYHEEGKDAVKLIFAKDFTLTYKNNSKPGLAEVIVRGKGAYKGRKLATFNIIKN
jgi:hypothetical protein